MSSDIMLYTCEIAQSEDHGFVEPKVEISNLSFHLDKVEPYGLTMKPMPAIGGRSRHSMGMGPTVQHHIMPVSHQC